MKTNPPFRAEHIGSLLRPQSLKDAWRRSESGAITKSEYSAIVDDANPNTQTGAAISGIRGMTFKAIEAKEVLFIGSSDGKVYKGFFAENVTTNPKGLAFSPSSASVGEALWIVVDGSPKDKILKVAASETLDATLTFVASKPGELDAWESGDVGGFECEVG